MRLCLGALPELPTYPENGSSKTQFKLSTTLHRLFERDHYEVLHGRITKKGILCDKPHILTDLGIVRAAGRKGTTPKE